MNSSEENSHSYLPPELAKLKATLEGIQNQPTDNIPVKKVVSEGANDVVSNTVNESSKPGVNDSNSHGVTPSSNISGPFLIDKFISMMIWGLFVLFIIIYPDKIFDFLQAAIDLVNNIANEIVDIHRNG